MPDVGSNGYMEIDPGTKKFLHGIAFRALASAIIFAFTVGSWLAWQQATNQRQDREIERAVARDVTINSAIADAMQGLSEIDKEVLGRIEDVSKGNSTTRERITALEVSDRRQQAEIDRNTDRIRP